MAVEYGPYVQLLRAAQADTNPERARQAHAWLARIGPSAGSIGADGRCPGDSLAAPMLARLYAPPAPQQQPDVIQAAARALNAGDPDQALTLIRGTLAPG